MKSNIAPAPRSDDAFPALLDTVRDHFSQGDGPYFTTDAKGLYEDFLAALPSDLRQTYTCHACRRFLETYGGLVTISPSGVASPAMWPSLGAPEPFGDGAARVSHRQVGLMGCSTPGSSHYAGCACNEEHRQDQVARLTRERDEARERERLAKRVAERAVERAAGLSRELLTAIRARDSYRASADLRVGMRREFEELLGCGDTTGEEAFERGLIRLRALVAAERRAEEADAYAGRANARIADLGERLDATEAVLRDAEKARKEAEERLTLKRREYDIEVEVHAATKRERDSYIKGYAAAESRAERLLAALREIAWHELPVGTAMDAIFQDIARRAIAAEEGK